MVSSILSRAAVAAGLLASTVSAAFSATSNQNVVVYWGQGSNQIPLSKVCADPDVDIVNIAFIIGFPKFRGDLPKSDFANACGAAWYPNPDGTPSGLLSSCPGIGPGIDLCHANGKKVLLSLGGGWPRDYYLPSEDVAKYFAEFLWGAFGPVTSAWTNAGKPRPFGNSYVDGFDLDIESDANWKYYDTLVNHFKKVLYPQQPSGKFYISAAPQCPTQDVRLSAAIKASEFDFIFIQFYNTPYCNLRAGYNGIGKAKTEFTFDGWVSEVKTGASKNARIYLGMPAGIAGAPNDPTAFLSPTEANALVTFYKNKYPTYFGGVMLWEATVSDRNPIKGASYIAWIKQICTGKFTGENNPPKPSSSSISSTKTSSSFSSTKTSTISLTSTKTSSSVSSTKTSSSVSSTKTSSSVSSTKTSSSSSSSTKASSSLSSSKASSSSSSTNVYSVTSLTSSSVSATKTSSSSSSSDVYSVTSLSLSSSSAAPSTSSSVSPSTSSSSSSSDVYSVTSSSSSSSAASSTSSSVSPSASSAQSSSSSDVYSVTTLSSSSSSAASSTSSSVSPSASSTQSSSSSDAYSVTSPSPSSSAASSTSSSVSPSASSAQPSSSSDVYSVTTLSSSSSSAAPSTSASVSSSASSIQSSSSSSASATEGSSSSSASASVTESSSSSSSSASVTESLSSSSASVSASVTESSSSSATPSATVSSTSSLDSSSSASSTPYPTSTSTGDKHDTTTPCTTSTGSNGYHTSSSSQGYDVSSPSTPSGTASSSSSQKYPEQPASSSSSGKEYPPLPTVTPKPTSSGSYPVDDKTVTVITTTYVDACPTGLTTITTTVTKTVCNKCTKPTDKPEDVPEGWTTSVYVCTKCGPKTTTVTLTKPVEPTEYPVHGQAQPSDVPEAYEEDVTSVVEQYVTLTKVAVPYTPAPQKQAHNTGAYVPSSTGSGGAYPTKYAPPEFEGAASRAGVGLTAVVVLMAGVLAL